MCARAFVMGLLSQVTIDKSVFSYELNKGTLRYLSTARKLSIAQKLSFS